MKSIEEALTIIGDSFVSPQKNEVEILETLGCVLAEDLLSPINLPPFSQSAMDGYALCGKSNVYQLKGEMKAGDEKHVISLNDGEAMRIFTGAMIPENTTAIAKQEIVRSTKNEIELLEEVKEGTSIRIEGEELKKGAVALNKGTRINSAAIGLVSGLGVQKLKIWRKPKVGVVVSGNELTKLGDPLDSGKIYESNSYTLKASLMSIGIASEVLYMEDDFDETVEVIQKQLEACDIVIITGGISVGDYDFVKGALEKLQIEELFYKLKQKPGKPIFYGKKGEKRIFALPGNPAAVLTCFYMYVVPSIYGMMGREDAKLKRETAIMTQDFTKKGDRGYLLKAKVENGKVDIHIGQSSAMLSSFVEANCLLYLKEDDYEIKAGDKVEVFLIN